VSADLTFGALGSACSVSALDTPRAMLPPMRTPEKVAGSSTFVLAKQCSHKAIIPGHVELVELPDPNLCCAICHSLFTTPVRTQCGHIFCAGCLHTWLPLKPECPECRDAVDPATLQPDRLADSLVSNLQGFCQLRNAGCEWVGKRGDFNWHLANECLCAPVFCPNEGCGCEMRRSELSEHLRQCDVQRQQMDCPWGCGARLSTDNIDRHKGECLMDPQKLMAAISQLARENALLTAENQRLRHDSQAESSGSDASEQRVHKSARRRPGSGPGVSFG